MMISPETAFARREPEMSDQMIFWAKCLCALSEFHSEVCSLSKDHISDVSEPFVHSLTVQKSSRLITRAGFCNIRQIMGRHAFGMFLINFAHSIC